jgi:hypothetical protein
LTKYQEAIKTLNEAHFSRLPSNLNVYPDPGQYVTKVTDQNFGILVGMADSYIGYVFDSDGAFVERIEVEREKDESEKNIPEAQVEILSHGEIREIRPEEGEELDNEG